MDVLYLVGRAQFHQLVTYISLHHENNSDGYRHLGERSLREVGLRPERFTLWNVPRMQQYLGKAVPLDIHGRHVLVDEVHALPMASSYGMLRYAYLACAVRAKEGGRQRYDFVTMNAALWTGMAAGWGLLYAGRRRTLWMRRRPVAAVLLSMGCCLFVTVVVRQTIKSLGVGIVQAQRSHRKALQTLNCVDCLDDVHAYTRAQMEELSSAPSAAAMQPRMAGPPGLAPPMSPSSSSSSAPELPPDVAARLKRGVEMQRRLLELDVQEVRLARRHADGKLCAVHTGLRSDPEHYQDEHGLALLASDRARAAERVAAEQQQRVSDMKSDDTSHRDGGA